MPTRRALLAGAAGLALTPASRRAQAAEAASVTFGPATPVYALSNVALERKLFQEEGLDLKVVLTDAGARARQNLAAGEALFAHGDASHPLQLTNRGKRARIVLATQMVASYATHCIRQDLYEAGIDSLEKLAQWRRPNGGKPVVGVTAIGSGTWMFSTLLFQRRGLDKNVVWVASGGTSTTLAGLKSKQLDAITAPPSWQVEVERNGFGRAIYDVRAPGVWQRDFGGNLPVLTVYTLEDTINERPEAVQRFVTAMVRAMAWMRDAPTDAVYDLVGPKHYTGVDARSAKAEIAFDPQTWPAYNGLLTREDFARGGMVWNRPGTDIPPTRYEDVVDMRFVETALKKVG